jgi:hypothetical protein
MYLRSSHNPKVGGSNPPPATNLINQLQTSGRENRLTIDSHKFFGTQLTAPRNPCSALDHSIVAALLAADPQSSYLRRHCALSRASSRQTGGNELKHAATLFPGRVLPIYSYTCDSPFSGLRPRMYEPVAVRSDSRSTLHGHAATYGGRAYLARRRSVGFNTCPARGGRA